MTSRVVEAKWFVGQKKAWQNSADNSVLENSGKLQPFRSVRIQSFDGTTSRAHWIGWVESIKPLPGQ